MGFAKLPADGWPRRAHQSMRSARPAGTATLLITAERKFWRCVENGEPPRLFGINPPRPRLAAVRIVDMTGSNAWAEFAAIFRTTRQAFLDHEKSKVELKALLPEDVAEASGHGVKAKRAKSGAVSFELIEPEDGDASRK
jgi:hypothetical protein